jgi:hypothetical protein
LDIYAQSSPNVVTPMVEDVVQWQTRAHEPIRRAFMMALTERALERWWGGK